MKVSCVSAKQAVVDAIIVGVASKGDKRQAPGLEAFDQAAHAVVARWLGNKNAGPGVKQVQSVLAEGRSEMIVLVGLGDTSKLTQEKLGTCISKALNHVKGLGLRTAATTLVTDSGMEHKVALQAVVQGAVIGDLQFDQYKSRAEKKEEKQEHPEAAIDELQIVHPRPAGLRVAAEKAMIVADAVNDARLLANTPANIANPHWLAAEARKRGKQHGFKVSVKGRQALRNDGFGALCGVAQGSENEEQLIVMTYEPEKVTSRTKTLAVVGKGVCFDSGGISIKPGQGMWDMKYDKCGACNTIALMGAVAGLGLKHRVVGIAPCVENMPSGMAQRPGDIVTAKDGTTIEVLNTDAEGRLIVADAITFARTFDPNWIVDMATLTGACDVAVGSTYVAVMSKDDGLAAKFVEASHAAGDKAWRLPQGEEFDEANKGSYADLQNISLTNKAGTCIGGSFVGHFAKDTPFVHLDIASKAWTGGTDYFAKGPTGAGLRIVVQRLMDEP